MNRLYGAMRPSQCTDVRMTSQHSSESSWAQTSILERKKRGSWIASFEPSPMLIRDRERLISKLCWILGLVHMSSGQPSLA
jgi:hypothetical protein